jgi:hypothetical protein
MTPTSVAGCAAMLRHVAKYVSQEVAITAIVAGDWAADNRATKPAMRIRLVFFGPTGSRQVMADMRTEKRPPHFGAAFDDAE